MADKQLSTLPIETPEQYDQLIFVDTSDSDNTKINTIEEIVKEGLSSNTTDSLSEWPTNKYTTTAEKNKLATIAPNAEVNEVESVNGKQWIVTLNLDEIPNGISYVKSQNNFTNLQLTRVTNGEAHRNNTANPHWTTKAHVGLDQIKNVTQISSDPDEFSQFAHKTSPHINDRLLIENSSDVLKKRYITIGDIVTEYFKPVVTRFKNSLEVDIDDKVQLVGDEAIPQHRYAYQIRDWIRQRASMMPKNIVAFWEELVIDQNDQYLVFGPMTVDGVVSWDWDLVVL